MESDAKKHRGPSPSRPESHERVRAVKPISVPLPMRLVIVRDALSEGTWLDAPRRPLADALRAVTLELAELDDARTPAHLHLESHGLLPATLAYLERANAYGHALCDAIGSVILAPDAIGRAQASMARALDAWEGEVPLDVVFEVAERGSSALRRRVHSVQSAWERSVRGVVDRLVAAPTWDQGG